MIEMDKILIKSTWKGSKIEVVKLKNIGARRMWNNENIRINILIAVILCVCGYITGI